MIGQQQSQSLIQFISTSEHPLVVNSRAPAVKTVTDWIDDCIEMMVRVSTTQHERK